MNQIKLKRKVGEGISGKVYLATYVTQGGKTLSAAVKQVPSVKMNLDEVVLQAALSRQPKCNRYIACYYDLIRHPKSGDYFIVMEYIHGKDLWTFLQDHVSQLTDDKIVELFKQALKGLKFIHSKGIAHGDIKLENFLIDEEFGRLKYIDFGFGCSRDTCKTSPVWHGTRFLSPPEIKLQPQRRKTLESIQKVDLWALGSMFAEIIMSGRQGHIVRTDELGLDGASAARSPKRWNPSAKLQADLKSNRSTKMKRVFEVIGKLMDINPSRRISAAAALEKLKQP